MAVERGERRGGGIGCLSCCFGGGDGDGEGEELGQRAARALRTSSRWVRDRAVELPEMVALAGGGGGSRICSIISSSSWPGSSATTPSATRSTSRRTATARPSRSSTWPSPRGCRRPRRRRRRRRRCPSTGVLELIVRPFGCTYVREIKVWVSFSFFLLFDSFDFCWRLRALICVQEDLNRFFFWFF